MKQSMIAGWNSFLKLFRFLAWYGVAVVTIFYLLPISGLMLEAQYEALSGTVRFFAVLGFFLVVGAWQVLSMRDRWRQPQLAGS